MGYSIAIDGPAGAGKSTIAKKIAKKENLIYVDTGAMYRAMGIHLINKNVDVTNEALVSSECQNADITIKYENGEQQVYLNGENVTGGLRTEQVGDMASKCSVYKDVRAKLVELQQKLAETTDVIMDGRDIGTVVLPNANVKIFLTASSAVRSKRRFDELTAKGQTANLEEIEKDIIERDHRDMNRENSPLKMADDSILVDTSYMDIDEVCETIIGIAKEKGGR